MFVELGLNGALETLREDIRQGTRAISTDWLDSELLIEGSCVTYLTSRCIRLETTVRELAKVNIPTHTHERRPAPITTTSIIAVQMLIMKSEYVSSSEAKCPLQGY